jgi:hypothetical protein
MQNKRKVANIDGMDAKVFAQHFTLRHKRHLGGGSFLPENLSEEMLKLHKVFHKKIHELEIDLDHEHTEG